MASSWQQRGMGRQWRYRACKTPGSTATSSLQTCWRLVSRSMNTLESYWPSARRTPDADSSPQHVAVRRSNTVSVNAKVPRVGEEYALLNSTIPAMHSFVHSGAHAVVHALLPSYPTDKLMALLWNRNLLHLYTANCAVVAAGNALLSPRLRLLQEKHAACMPPSPPAEGAHL
jgi:hypothetical protein